MSKKLSEHVRCMYQGLEQQEGKFQLKQALLTSKDHC